jgi:hypothetical protein
MLQRVIQELKWTLFLGLVLVQVTRLRLLRLLPGLAMDAQLVEELEEELELELELELEQLERLRVHFLLGVDEVSKLEVSKLSSG